MTPVGIALSILGIFVIVISYFVPDKEDREDKKDIEKKQEQIRRLVETEIDGMKLRVNEATNETVEFGMEKSERALEKITNEKIMAVSEYASTVMEEIDRNHKEVMFLYDMLSDKQTDVKNTVRHAEAAVKEANDAAKTASDTALYAVNVANQAGETVSSYDALNSQNDMQALTAQLSAVLNERAIASEQKAIVQDVEKEPEKPAVIDMIPTESLFDMAANMDSFTAEETAVIEPVAIKPEEPKEEPQRELTEIEMLERSTSFNNVSNNNQMILKLSAQGMTAVDIARQLSLGVGEVQLVIDLFK